MQNAECLIPTFEALTNKEIELINKNSHVIRHKPGEIIFMQERPVSHLIYIKSGLVKLHKYLDDQSEIILDILLGEEFVGLTSIFYENLYPYSATSIEGGELIYVNSQIFREIIAGNGKYALRIISFLSSKVVFLIDKMIAYSKKQVPGRLAEMLLHFSRDIYKNDVFALPLSRQEIADLVRSTKETVSRTLSEFKNDRIIEMDEKKVKLRSLDLLEILNKIG